MSVDKLKLLKYPKEVTEDILTNEAKEFKLAVIFLEEEHIRLLTADNRSDLRLIEDTDSEKYTHAFMEYISELDFPEILVPHATRSCSSENSPLSASSRAIVLQFLLNRAFSGLYNDNKTYYNQITSDRLSKFAQVADTVFAGESEEVVELVEKTKELFAVLQLPPVSPHVVNDMDDSDDKISLDEAKNILLANMREIWRRVCYEIVPFLTATATATTTPSPSPSSPSDLEASLSSISARSQLKTHAISQLEVLQPHHPPTSITAKASYPNISTEEAYKRLESMHSLTVGNEVFNHAVTIARIAHNNDIREMQHAINEIIVLCQEFTANPVTDSSLGVVGK